MVRFWSAGHILTIGTNMAACSSFCCLFLSIVTDSWLCTKERAMVSNGSFVYVTIYSGLWRRCTLDPRSLLPTTFNCSYIGYFTHVERDGIGPTDSILLSLRKATGFPMVGLVLMLVAQTVCFVSHCSLYRQCLTITFGVMFVSGGLLTLVGIIIYIGAITEEAGNKMKSKDEFPFLYFYGPSLVMAIFSFIASQMTGVIAVNLFLSRKRQRIRCANKATANSQQSTAAVVASATVAASLATSGDSKKAILEAFEGDMRRDLETETFIMDQKKCIGEDIEVCPSTKQHQQQYHLFHQLQQQQQYYNTHEQQNQQQQQHLKRPTLVTSNSVDYYYQHHLPQQQQHSKRDFIRQESFDVTSAVQIPLQPAPDRLRRLVRNYSEETYSWRIHGSGNITPDRSLENISLSVHRLQQNRGYPKSSSHGRLAQTMARQSSNASRSPDGGMTAKYGSSTLLHRLHQTNQLSRSRLRINNSTVDWPSSTLASANQRRVIGSSHALGAEARREKGGVRRPEMSRQWSEMTPEEGRLFSQSRDRLRLSHEELNLSHRRITPV